MRLATTALMFVASIVMAQHRTPTETAFALARSRVPILPDGAVRYEPTVWTQSIYTMNNFTTHFIDKVPISGLERKWHQSGGLEGIDKSLWSSEKYKVRPNGSKTWIKSIQVENGSGNTQPNRAIVQEFVDGTRFDDVLRNSLTGQVFEHRVREKRGGKWSSKVVYRDEKQYPKGYTGLTVTCASCHDQAGTGGYATGLVPGGDTVLSEPLAWYLAERVND